jgi:NADH-ubiquinone oxidoreductase chain 4
MIRFDFQEIIKIIINNYLFPIIIILCSLSIIFGSFSTIRQIDIKRIIAYSSIIHMNYSIISIFTLEYKSLIGGAFLIISHALISSGLFLLIGILYIRYSTRLFYYYQNLTNYMPLFSTCFFLLILNLISIPFSSSFISEFLILSGLLKSNLYISILLSFSLFFNTFYSI